MCRVVLSRSPDPYFTGVQKYFFGGVAIGIDAVQGDGTGVLLGIGSMASPYVAPADILYGIEQVNK